MDVGQSTVAEDLPAFYYLDGNCIILALLRLLGNIYAHTTLLSQLGEDHRERCSMGRNYRDVSQMVKVTLEPTRPEDWKADCLSKWVFHCEHNEKPHAFAVHVVDASTVNVYSARHVFRMTSTALISFMANAVDKRLLMLFRIANATKFVPPDPSMPFATTLDMRAWGGDTHGTCESILPVAQDTLIEDALVPQKDDIIVEDETEYPYDIVEDDDDLAQIHVDEALFASLRAEVLHELRRACKASYSGNGVIHCRFCNDKVFRGKRRYLYISHLETVHMGSFKKNRTNDLHGPLIVGSQNLYHHLPDGRSSKHLKTIKALFDDDALKGKSSTTYLERSQQIMRNAVPSKELALARKNFDRNLGLLMTSNGPRWFHVNGAARRGTRQLGYMYYDADFALELFRTALFKNGRYRTIQHSFVRKALRASNPLWSLLPTRQDKWAELIEDIWSSPMVRQYRMDLLNQCLDMNEFLHVSVDATLRVARRVKGQADYRDTKHNRNTKELFLSLIHI